MFDVVALGELLMDLTYYGKSQHYNDLFEANPGGAPANVVSCLAQLGMRTGFIGKVGDDHFGHELREVLDQIGVSTKGIIMDQTANTSLAFVHLASDGERDFSFCRTNGADTRLRSEEISPDMFDTRIFHFGSLSLTDEPARSATLHALSEIRKRNALVSYDPNLRPLLWRNLHKAKKQILGVMNKANIVKVSDEELEFLTGIRDIAKASKRLFDDYGPEMLFVTLGEQGCHYKVGAFDGQVPGFEVDTIDTTGAGDAFLGGMLFKVLESNKQLNQWRHEDVIEAVRFANAVGALATTKKGAIPAMPSAEEIYQILDDNSSDASIGDRISAEDV